MRNLVSTYWSRDKKVDISNNNDNYRGEPKVETNTRLRYCKHCKRKLSKFNLNKYCFTHLIHNVKRMDKEYFIKKRKESVLFRIRKKLRNKLQKGKK